MASQRAKRLWAFAFLAVLVVAVEVYCPFTKVEESFNMQAMHDFLYETDAARFDHHRYPGVVPRTFLGAWAVSLVALPLLVLLRPFAPRLISPLTASARSSAGGGGVLPLLMQERPMLASHACRLSLATLVLLSLLLVATAMDRSRREGRGRSSGDRPAKQAGDEPRKRDFPSHSHRSSRGAVFLYLCAAQFHLVLYASRPLPNTFGLLFCNIALQQTLMGRMGSAVAALTAGAALFRCDLLVLLAPYGLYAVLIGACAGPQAGKRAGRVGLGLHHGIAIGLATAGVCVGTTALGLDSFLWGRWLWPEGSVLFFNTKENRSAEWGVMPWHWYWSKTLARALLCVYPAVLALGACTALHLALRLLALLSFVFRKVVGSGGGGGGHGAARRRGLLSWMPGGKLLSVATEFEPVLLPSLLFIACYSVLPHKELRFVLVAVPWLLAPVAALVAEDDDDDDDDRGDDKGEQEKGKRGGRVARSYSLLRWLFHALHRLTLLALYMAMLLSVVVSVAVTAANYPGSDALQRLHQQIVADAEAATSSPAAATATRSSCLAKNIGAVLLGEQEQHDDKTVPPQMPTVNVTVFIDAYAAMTGINRFQKRHTPIAVAQLPSSPPPPPHVLDGQGVGEMGAAMWQRWLRLLRLPIEALAWRTRDCLSPAPSTKSGGGRDNHQRGLFTAAVNALSQGWGGVSAMPDATTGVDAAAHALCPYRFDRLDTRVRVPDGRRHTAASTMGEQPAALVWLSYTKDPNLFLTPSEHAERRRRSAAGGGGPTAPPASSRHLPGGSNTVGQGKEEREVYRPEGIDYALVRASQRELHLLTHDDFELLFAVEERSGAMLRRWRRQGKKALLSVVRRLRGGGGEKGYRVGVDDDGLGSDAFLLALRRRKC